MRSEEEEHAELKLKKELGIPRRQLWRELGYDEAEVDEMLADLEVANLTLAQFP